MNIRELKQKEFGEILNNYKGDCAALISPRFGKTRMIINNCFKDQNILIAYPSLPIKASWKNEFKELSIEDNNITYTTFASLKKLELAQFDLIIIDECHKLSDNNVNQISKIHGKKIYMSGTISSKTRLKLRILNAPILIEYPIEQAVKDCVIADFEINVIYTTLEDKLKKSYNSISHKIEEIKYEIKSYGLLKILSLRRMRMLHRSENKIICLQEIIKNLEGKRFLVFTSETLLANHLGIPAYHSLNKNENLKEDFCNGIGNSLVVLKMFNQGVTVKPINSCVIHNYSSNPEELAQQLNRVTAFEYNNADKKAKVYITCIKDTQEEIWLQRALEFVPREKIFYYSWKENTFKQINYGKQ